MSTRGLGVEMSRSVRAFLPQMLVADAPEGPTLVLLLQGAEVGGRGIAATPPGVPEGFLVGRFVLRVERLTEAQLTERERSGKPVDSRGAARSLDQYRTSAGWQLYNVFAETLGPIRSDAGS